MSKKSYYNYYHEAITHKKKETKWLSRVIYTVNKSNYATNKNSTFPPLQFPKVHEI